MISKGIAFEYGDAGPSITALACWCSMTGFPRRSFRKTEEVPDDWLPYGNVQWVEARLGRKLVPDYFPEFLKGKVYRKTWTQDDWPIGRVVHVKPADTYKRFTGFVTNGSWKGKKRGPLLCSEIVTWTSEWRYYVANGKVVASHWYWGDESEPEAPELSIDWPTDFCGAVDFGWREDNRLELIESHHAVACGWYGDLDDGEIFAEWLDCGWQSVKKTG